MRGVLGTVTVLGLGWIAWRALHAHGLVALAAPSLGPLGGMVDDVADRITGRIGEILNGAPRASGDVDRISNTTDRAIAYARQGGVPARDVPLFAAIIVVESAVNPLAHNTQGEDSRGLMQIQLYVAQSLSAQGRLPGLPRADLGKILFDPVSNIRIGQALMRANRQVMPVEWQTSQARETEWLARAWNGGADWHQDGTGVRGATYAYWQKVSAALERVAERMSRPVNGEGA